VSRLTEYGWTTEYSKESRHLRRQTNQQGPGIRRLHYPVEGRLRPGCGIPRRYRRWRCTAVPESCCRWPDHLRGR